MAVSKIWTESKQDEEVVKWKYTCRSKDASKHQDGNCLENRKCTTKQMGGNWSQRLWLNCKKWPQGSGLTSFTWRKVRGSIDPGAKVKPPWTVGDWMNVSCQVKAWGRWQWFHLQQIHTPVYIPFWTLLIPSIERMFGDDDFIFLNDECIF